MNELIMICMLTAFVVFLLVIWPFFVGPGGLLQDASTSDSIAELDARLTAILKRWIKDEKAFESGDISRLEWAQRQRYLTSRYVDASRRRAWLQSTTSDEVARS